MADKKDPAADPDWDWLKVPALYCDTYTVDVWPKSGVVRLVFGEATSREYYPFYRAAVVMPLEDAKDLMKALERQIKRAETPKENQKESE